MEELDVEAQQRFALQRLEEADCIESRVFANRCRALVDLATATGWTGQSSDQDQFLAGEVAATSTVTLGTATADLHQAQHLLGSLPRTWQALVDGWLRVGPALVIMKETLLLDAALCGRVEQEVLPDAEGRTAASMQRLVRRVIARLRDAAEAEKSRQDAFARREVTTQPQPDGMATVWAEMTAEDAHHFMAALCQLGARAAGGDDKRTARQREADVLAALPQLALSALLSGEDASGPEGDVAAQFRAALAAAGFRLGGRVRPIQAIILVPGPTATGESQAPAELVGYGPITAGHAQTLLADAELRRAVLDPLTGRITALDEQVRRPAPGQEATELRRLLQEPLPDPPSAEPRHDPSPHLSRLVQLRDLTCIGPGTSRSSDRSDLEHLIPWPHGPTGVDNLAPVSRFWHRAKQAGWRYRRSQDGTTTWTSRLGRRYRVPADRWRAHEWLPAAVSGPIKTSEVQDVRPGAAAA